MVECQLPKLNVAGSNPVFRSNKNLPRVFDSGLFGLSVSFSADCRYSREMDDLELNCPHCGKKTCWKDNPSRPFCSEKCRIIDLGCWASEEYSVAGGEAPQLETDP